MPATDADDPRWVELSRTRWNDRDCEETSDRVAREEPLEIRIDGFPLAVVMRTPGHDHELVTGFLLTERVVASAREVAWVRHCDQGDVPEAEDNVMLVRLAEGVEFDPRRFARHSYAASSCGVCGKATIAAATATAPPLQDRCRVSIEILYTLPDRLRGGQEVFDRTGGLHAAGLFDRDGTPHVVREDVGRHNAIDKVVGWSARTSRDDLAGHVLCVSGRVSFEVVQKALAARIPVIVAVSAPSSLAIDLARAADVTLCAFVRGRSLGVYAGEHRIARP